VTVLMCGHCYRPATSTIYRQTWVRRLLRLPAEARQVCTPCVERYRNGTLS